ncbi:MAG TPA: GIY-YIG nuclease family protein [Candidatus Dormibacteraeota bacterium]|nr:GIY-YIG nuclease family protein [Candidatus Dormibacteraeota bacterium]
MAGTSAPRAAAALLPGAPGVYRFRDERGRVLYAGRAVDLRRRVGSYWGDLGDRRHLARMVARIDRVEAVVCDSEHEAAWLERNLLEHRLPPWNRTPGGAEVPAYIDLEPGPAAPGLRVVHEHERSAGGRRFGPYLGGTRVRLAVSGLHRVLPLPYAGERLGGGEREMARTRGVGPGDRAALVDALTAVLTRDPAAVRRVRVELARRRDAAAAGLAFELAARLREELAAVDWVVAEQKATRDEPCDLDVHGWAAGVLVTFEVRAGRLRAWRQRACAEAAAGPWVAATPAAWVEFARRNAELAARLAR